MYREIYFNEEARNKIKAGVDKLANVVKVTLGPKGRNVIIGKGFGAQNVTKDGVTVAKSVKLKDPVEAIGANMILEVATKTNSSAGDGPQPLNAKVLTPTGFVRMGDIKVGDTICGTDGTEQKVLGVFDKGNLAIIEVIFDDDRLVECSTEHLWSVITKNGQNLVLPTWELLKDFKESIPGGYCSYKYYVRSTAVELNEKVVPIDPYLLGVLLGDGSMSGTGSIELSLGLNKEHIISKLVLPDGIRMDSKFVKRKNYFRVKLYGKRMEELLSSLGLLGTTSTSKFIPEAYLYNSEEIRTALLQGLLDTDAHINGRGLFEYSTVSMALANDFLELVRGLGISVKGRLQERQQGKSYSMRPIYRISQRLGYKHGLKIKDIRTTNKITEMRCIKVSNPDNLYITNDYVATHNTTTATVLAQAMASEGLKNVTAGANPIALRVGMQKALKIIVERLKGLSVPVSGQMIAKVAGISANDQQIGDLIGEAMEKLGEHGILTVDESRGQEMELEVVKGLQWDNGFISPYMVTDLATMKCELENPLVLVSDKKFSSAEELLPFLEESASTGNKNLLIVCEDVTDQALGLAVVNKMKGIMNILCVKVHGFGSRKKANLEDIAVVCGAKLHASEMDIEFKISKEIFGTCDKVISAKDKTTIIGGKGDVKDRILQVQNELKTAGADFDRDRLKERLAKLEGGVGIIRVGAASEIEMVEKKYRVEDAINAARASVEEGIVTGAGTALFECSKLEIDLTGDEKIGFEIVRLACSRPAYLIAQNAGHDGAVILAELLKKPSREGFDSEKGEWVDLIEVGIIDPTKVVRCALENAVSVASTILTTEAVMVEIEERLASSGS